MKSHKLFGAKPKKTLAPPATTGIPACIFCGETRTGKVYMEGAIVEGGKFVWRFKGVTHHACAEEAVKRERDARK